METHTHVRNRAQSAMIGSFAGAIWMFWSLAFVGHAVVFWGPVLSALALPFLIWSITRVRLIRRHNASPTDPQSSNRFGWAFSAVVVIEFLLAGGTVAFLLATRRSHLIPVAIAFIVGLHFYPLAKLMRMRALYITATTMVVIAVISLAIPNANVRNVAVCSAIGLSMWTRAFIALQQIVSSLQVTSAA